MTEHPENNKMTRLVVVPNISLVDDDLHIKAYGVPPDSKVTVVCRVEEKGIRFFAWGYYKADGYGEVDMRTAPAQHGGSYHGVEPMGLIWSQKQEPGQKPGRRLAKSDVTTPLRTRFYLQKGFQSPGDCLQSITKDKFICFTTSERWYMGPGVQRLEIREGRLEGTMFIPKGSGPFPGVLDLFGTIGGTTEHRAALLASRGIASFALCYYKPSENNAIKTDIEYFEEAVEYMMKHPKVMTPYAGVIGVSQGAMIALLLASVCHKIKACIEINGMNFVNALNYTYKGEIFPYLELPFDAIETLPGGEMTVKTHLESISNEIADQYMMPIERADCQFIFMHGADDGWIPSSAADQIARRLQTANKTNFKIIKYPGTGHLLEPPHSPHFISTYQMAFGGLTFWGGEPRQHAKAQELSWPIILNFFKSTLTEVNSTNKNTPKHKL